MACGKNLMNRRKAKEEANDCGWCLVIKDSINMSK